MPIYALGDRVPQIHADAFMHPDAVVIGDVRIGADSSIWPCAVLRGDYGTIIVGERTSIQDGAVIHAVDEYPDRHRRRLRDRTPRAPRGLHRSRTACSIGSGSIVLHEVVVHSGATVGAGAVVRNRTDVPDQRHGTRRAGRRSNSIRARGASRVASAALVRRERPPLQGRTEEALGVRDCDETLERARRVTFDDAGAGKLETLRSGSSARPATMSASAAFAHTTSKTGP